jgi:hypothetical protein
MGERMKCLWGHWTLFDGQGAAKAAPNFYASAPPPDKKLLDAFPPTMSREILEKNN